MHEGVEYLPQAAGVVPLAHGGRKAAVRVDGFPADEHEAGRRADRPRRDEHPLDERVRVALEQVAVLERPGLALVGVDDEVHGPRVVLRDERPLRPRREARTAEPAEVGLLDLLGDRRRRARPGLLPGGVAAGLAVSRERVRVGTLAMVREGLLARN